MKGTAEDADQFGSALAVGDFDGDRRVDTAIGIPGESKAGNSEAGAVAVLYSNKDGASAAGDQIWHRDRPGVAGARRTDARFGDGLAAADFDGDGFWDLSIGVPRDEVSSNPDAGSVTVLYGSGSKLSVSGSQKWTQASAGVPDSAQAGDMFGGALLTGDFDGDGLSDHIVGSPREDIGASPNAGVVHIFYGSQSGLSSNRVEKLSQASPGVADAAEQGDLFGALAG